MTEAKRAEQLAVDLLESLGYEVESPDDQRRTDVWFRGTDGGFSGDPTVTVQDYEDVDYHRNGVSGEGFYVVKFQSAESSGGVTYHSEMVGVVFPDLRHVAVFRLDGPKGLDERVIAFGRNSHRGDRFERPLRDAIAKHGLEGDYSHDSEFSNENAERRMEARRVFFRTLDIAGIDIPDSVW